MPIRPYDNLTYITPLTSAEVKRRLAEQVETDLDSYATTDKLYMGKFEDDTFEIYRRIRYQNSFLPVIQGVIEEASDGCAVNVAMRLAPQVMWFMMFWILFTGGLGLYGAWTVGSGQIVWQPFGMMAFGYGLATIGFTRESRKAKEFLGMVLNAKEA